jgi:AcrR family transcriptional regulator
MPRPRSLRSDQIAASALAVIDADGLGALSMRSVAKQLRIGTMSLYRYVTDRRELEELVVDMVLDEAQIDVRGASTRRKLGMLADAVRVAASEHSAVVPLLMTHRHRSLASLRWGETVLRALADAGFSGKRRVIAFRTILAYVFGAVQLEHFGPLAGQGTAEMAGLPREEFPVLTESAAQAQAVLPEEEFRRGFDIVLRGLGL